MPSRPLPPDLAAEVRRRDRILDERTATLARRRAPGEGWGTASGGATVLVCAVGEALYGLPLARLGGVLPAGPVTPLPGTPPAVLGLMARMGHFVCVLDLGVALGQAAPAAAAGGLDGHLVMLRRAEGSRERRLALRVDRALRVEHVVPIEEGGAAEPGVRFRGTAVATVASLASSPATGAPGVAAPATFAAAAFAPASGVPADDPRRFAAPLVSVVDDHRLLEPFLASFSPASSSPAGA